MSKFKTIKFSQLMASVEDDIKKYADEGLVNRSGLIKIVRRCNETLGLNIYDKKQCVIPVKNYKADLPLDFYKMEMVFALGEGSYHTGPIATGNHYEWETVQNACFCDNDTAVCVTPLEQHQKKVKYTKFQALSITNGDHFLTEYSPNRGWNSKYGLDLQEDLIKVPFEKGLLFVSYLADLSDPVTGEVLIPFDSRLNDYYEYSIKAKIMEDIYINTQDDTFQKLQMFELKRNLAFNDAVDVTMSKTFKSWLEYDRKYKTAFFNKYFKIIL